MSSISAILKQSKVKRFQQEQPTTTMKGGAQTSLTLSEQVTEFMTTNGDTHLLPYLTKFDKATISQGKPLEGVHLFLNAVCVLHSEHWLQQHGQLAVALFVDHHGYQGRRRAGQDKPATVHQGYEGLKLDSLQDHLISVDSYARASANVRCWGC